MFSTDELSENDIDEIIFELNKHKNLGDKSNTHKFHTDDEKVYNEVETPKRGRPKSTKEERPKATTKGNRATLKVKVNIKNVYRYMNSVINYINTLNHELKFDIILEKGLDKINEDASVLGYVNKLNDIRKNESVCTTLRFSSWDSRDEDFHFLYECNEVYSISYSSDNDIRIGNLSHELKLHKHKVIAVALNYGAKSIMNEYNKCNTEIYNHISDEIKWFQDEYSIKTDNLSRRFNLDEDK